MYNDKICGNCITSAKFKEHRHKDRNIAFCPHYGLVCYVDYCADWSPEVTAQTNDSGYTKEMP
jgi:hypothetical protein